MNCDEKTRRGRAWGKAHGYYGIGFGWICHTSRQDTVARSWEDLYNRHRDKIEAWRNNRFGFSIGDTVWYWPSPRRCLAAVIAGFTPQRVRIAVERDQGKVKQQITRVVGPDSLTVRVPPLQEQGQ
jgi:hypothetical protein